MNALPAPRFYHPSLLTPTKPLVIRPMVDEDAEALDSIHRHCLGITLARHYTSEQLRTWREGWSPQGFVEARGEGDVIFVARRGERCIGFVGSYRGILLSLFVHPAAQKQGVGGHLLRHAMRVAEEQGEPLVFLRAALGAAPFYEKFGFSVVQASGEMKLDVFIPYVEMRRGSVPAPGEAETERLTQTGTPETPGDPVMFGTPRTGRLA